MSEDISELRDEINALAKDIFGGRLLLLSQERPLFDMYKSANSAEDFRSRIQSLGIIAKDLNRDLLRRLSSDRDSTADFVLLEKAIQTFTTPEIAATICTPLKHINNLRQGYPTHGDNSKNFLEAHRYFGLSYPISEYSAAWEAILLKYFDAMRNLRNVLSEAWNNRSASK